MTLPTSGLRQCQPLSKEGQLDKTRRTVSTSDRREEKKKRSERRPLSYSTWMIAIAGEGLIVYELGQKMEFYGRGFLEA